MSALPLVSPDKYHHHDLITQQNEPSQVLSPSTIPKQDILYPMNRMVRLELLRNRDACHESDVPLFFFYRSTTQHMAYTLTDTKLKIPLCIQIPLAI
jgi:hypothetical protein